MAEDLFAENCCIQRDRNIKKENPFREKCLEMIYKMYIEENERIKVAELVKKLKVSETALKNALQELVEAGLVLREGHNTVYLTEKGRCKAAYLLKRHSVLNEFFDILHGSGELSHSEAEIAECFLSPQTVFKLEYLNKMLKKLENEVGVLPQTVKI